MPPDPPVTQSELAAAINALRDELTGDLEAVKAELLAAIEGVKMAVGLSRALLTIDELLEVTRLPSKWVLQHVGTGEMPHAHVDGQIRFILDDVIDYLRTLRAEGEYLGKQQ